MEGIYIMKIEKLNSTEKKIIENIVSIHLDTFEGFFLSFMGKKFLSLMYSSYIEHKDSGIFVAYENSEMVGFLAYSGDQSDLYKYMIRKKLILFALCSIGAFFRKPTIFLRLIRAFHKPNEVRREEKYIELASIGVDPKNKSRGIGSKLIENLKKQVNFNDYSYISLETDAINNDIANNFYKKNGFTVAREYETIEGRKMFEYRWKK